MVSLQNTELRKLSLADFEILKMFHVKHFQNYKISEESFRAYLSQNQYQTFGMFHVKHLVGYIIFLVSESEADIVYIATHPDFRRQGIGRALLDALEPSVPGFKIFLEVATSNTGAIEFYTKQGFCINSIRHKYLNGQDSYLMIKKL